MNEIDNLIGKTLKNIEDVDFLIGSPIEPFCQEIVSSGIFAPSFEYICTNSSDLKDLLYSAEKTGFKLSPMYDFPTYDPAKGDREYRLLNMEMNHAGARVRFVAFIYNAALMEYELNNRLASIK